MVYHSKNIQSMEIGDFIKCLKKNVDHFREDDKVELIKDIIKDCTFSSSLYKKLEELLNVFFDQ